jgi:prepilin-type N-terminal cleavage/methylation domain-containing protein
MRNTHRIHRTAQLGFTLVEMSIVLVIIGIILASVMKGRDLIYSAKETQVEQAFFQKWRTILNDYYKGTGYVLGDGEINGGNGTVDSFADYLTFYDDNDNNKKNIKNALRMAGIDPCVLISGNTYGDDNEPKCTNNMDVFQYKVDSENVGLRTVTMGVGNTNITVHANSDSNNIGRKNLLLFFNVPIDYAKRIDKLIDGVSLGEEGKCLNLSGYDGKGWKESYDSAWNTTYGNTFFNGGDRDANPWPSPKSTTAEILSNNFVLGIILDF